MDHLNIIFDNINSKQSTMLIFDYDGTLAEIKPSPDQAKLSNTLKVALENLAEIKYLRIAIVTGRKIQDLKEVSGLNTDKMIVFGLHGGEIELANKTIGGIFNYEDRNYLNEFYKAIKSKTNNLNGLLIEDKEFSVVLHYRNSDEDTAKIAIQMFNDTFQANSNENFKVMSGKKVVEVLPANFSKSRAVNELIKSHEEFFPFYFGDDITDISALEEVKKFNGCAVAIVPNSFPSKDIADFEISQKELENFLVNLSNTYSSCQKLVQ